MPIIYECFNASVTGDNIQPVDVVDEDETPRAAVVLWTPRLNNFVVKIKTSADYSRVLFGIASGTSVNDTDLVMSCGYFIELQHTSDEGDDGEPAMYEVPMLRKLSNFRMTKGGPFVNLLDLEQQEPCELPDVLRKRAEGKDRWHDVCLAFQKEPALALSFGLDGGPIVPVCFNEPIVEGVYRPCILLLDWQANDITVVESPLVGQKRKRNEMERCTTGNFIALWHDRSFADATVQCQGQDFRVHRAVLCCQSRVFATLFQGQGQEGITATIDMTAEDPAAVAALLEHAYTTKLTKDVDPAVLLPLADRFEMSDCVDDCSGALESLVETHPTKVIRALRPYSNDERLRQTWDRVCCAVLRNPELAVVAFQQL